MMHFEVRNTFEPTPYVSAASGCARMKLHLEEKRNARIGLCCEVSSLINPAAMLFSQNLGKNDFFQKNHH
jgi:hypothetical protein